MSEDPEKFVQEIESTYIDVGNGLYHDDDTMSVVRGAMLEFGLSDQQTVDLINKLQNAGILFRERYPGYILRNELIQKSRGNT